MTDNTVRAMTWNLWWRFGPRWQDRQPGIRATLQRLNPDVVALQEVWAGDGTTQAHELAQTLQMNAVFASPSYPAAPDDPASGDWTGIDLGIAVLSRWPILAHQSVVMPARHRSWDPVALSVQIAHPAGTLPVVAACLEYGVAYTDDRIAQGTFVADMVTDPRFDGRRAGAGLRMWSSSAARVALRAVRQAYQKPIEAAFSSGGGSSVIPSRPDRVRACGGGRC